MLDVMVTSAPVERCQRKRLGAFYSPQALVEPMVAWAVHRADQEVLDPSCGDGVFLEHAARRLRHLGATPERAASLLHAVDLNPEAAHVTRSRLSSALGRPFDNVRMESFFSLTPPGTLFGPPEGVDVVIGNPPYIRYQEFAGGARLEALERATDAGVQLSRLASSWAHFVVHALEFLRPGGRLALILPAELIHTTYAAPLRRHLRNSFEEVRVISFRQAVFPGVQAEVVLLLVPLGEVGKANIGFVSGANEYFVVTPEEASRWRLPESSLRSALVRARQIPGLQSAASSGSLASG